MKVKKGKKVKRHRLIEGLPVVDANHNLHIEISPSDVKHSKKGDAANCAAAVACKRKFKTEVRVFLTKTYIKGKKHWVRYETPEAISREIIAFDRGSAFVPGRYKLNSPSTYNRLGAKKPTGPKKKAGEPRQYHHVTKQVRSYKEQTK